MSTQDSGVPNGSYRYRVDVRNWANTAQSTVFPVAPASTTVSVVTLLAPTNVAATSVNSPVVSWTDQSSGETGYRVRRIAQTISATTGLVTTGATTTAIANTGAGIANTGAAGTFTDTGATRGTVYKYEVAALNGATVGTPTVAAGFTLAATAGMPTANRPTATASIANTVRRVTVGWATLADVAVGGYEIQRCIATGAGSTTCAAGSPFNKVVNPLAVNTAGTVDGRTTASYIDSGLARNTNYVYRMRAVSGAGIPLVGAFSTLRAVSTN
jgi:hypothetical protein